MHNVYLLHFNERLGTKKEVKNWLDSIDEVESWHSDSRYVFYIRSNSSAHRLYEELMKRCEKAHPYFLLIELNTANMQGRQNSATWAFLLQIELPEK
jgi:hypothetical protein